MGADESKMAKKLKSFITFGHIYRGHAHSNHFRANYELSPNLQKETKRTLKEEEKRRKETPLPQFVWQLTMSKACRHYDSLFSSICLDIIRANMPQPV